VLTHAADTPWYSAERMDERHLEVKVGELAFDCAVAGADGAPLVLLLHGFPQTRYTWRRELPALAAIGCQAVAPDQRGYSPRARPAQVDEYAVSKLIADALAIADHFGAERFHLVGHDWGGQLAWLIAAHHPQRVRSLSVLSRPHPAAFAQALQNDAAQTERSRHHSAYRDPDTARRLLEDDARRLRALLTRQGVPEADAAHYVAVLSDEAALNAALNWYRAPRSESGFGSEVPAIAAPTLYVWGDADATVARSAAEATARFVRGPYRFLVVPGAGHFLTDQAGEQVVQAIATHIAALR
jgi:pimeloyl-ACP methyl ester carboxylesterase